MHRASYLACFGLVAVSTLALFILWTLQHTGGNAPPGLVGIAQVFGHPVPDIAKRTVPAAANITLFLAQLLLVVRRLVLMAKARTAQAPAAYTGIVVVLFKIAAASVMLALLVLLASMALRAGSGVPAGLALLPAVALLPYALLWVEIRSLKAANQ